MNKKYIVGNWKSNKTEPDIEIWFQIISDKLAPGKNSITQETTVVVCPVYTHLPLVKKLIEKYQLPIHIGAQDISPFDTGAYTGEVAGVQIAQYAEYVLVGHSERRKYFHEDDALLQQKVKQAQFHNLSVIYCVPDDKTAVATGVNIVAYEPVWAIGTGKTDTGENANKVAASIKKSSKVQTVLYGGSVTDLNCNEFLTQKNIDGLLPGSASLDAIKFWNLINNVTST